MITSGSAVHIFDRVQMPVIRRRCCYCVVRHPIDDLGPIRSHELVSDGMCEDAFAREMATLDAMEKR